MGRNVSLGIYPSNLKTLIGRQSDRPASTNAGVQFYNTDTDQLEIYNGDGWHPVRDTLAISAVNSNTNLVSNRNYWVTGSGLTLTLPSAPNAYDTIKITDTTGNIQASNLTIARNGKNIMGQADNMLLDTNGASVTLVYYDTSRGWTLEAI